MALPYAQRTARAYQRTRVETARPAQLILMLYDGAIRFLSVAHDSFGTREIEARHTNIVKAQRILSELLAWIDRDGNPSLADNLVGLYVYMYNRLIDANVEDTAGPVEEVIGMLRELRSAWAEVDQMQPAAAAA